MPNPPRVHVLQKQNYQTRDPVRDVLDDLFAGLSPTWSYIEYLCTLGCICQQVILDNDHVLHTQRIVRDECMQDRIVLLQSLQASDERSFFSLVHSPMVQSYESVTFAIGTQLDLSLRAAQDELVSVEHLT